jgi:uncharacterized membrane protein YdjX (TVP38/TMEM64 family)
VTAAFKSLGKKYGDKKWDLFLRIGGGVALAGIPISLYLPGTIPLVWLALVAIPANSPLSPIIPTAFEPMLMIAAKYASPLATAIVATTAYMFTEFVNWHVYSWALSWEKLKSVSESKWVKWGMTNFAKAPFFVTVFFAFSPMPFWAVRGVAILQGYPIRSFMTATALGRFPRLFIYAWFGEVLLVPTPILLGIIFGGAAIVIVVKLLKGKSLLGGTVLDAD